LAPHVLEYVKHEYYVKHLEVAKIKFIKICHKIQLTEKLKILNT